MPGVRPQTRNKKLEEAEMNYLIACVLTVSSLMPPQPSAINRAALPPGAPIESPCAAGAFTVAEQPTAPARLSITEAVCDGPSWRARLTLTNTGDKVISGYEVANVEEYEHKKGVESSQGEDGIDFGPGESKEIAAGGGFRGGRSYGRATGSIRKNVFRVARIEFADGTSWREEQNR
jgi:hypothetical protein